MAKLLYKKNDGYDGFQTYGDIKYSEEQYELMKEEFYKYECLLEHKFKPYSSEYCYELGIYLKQKLEEYRIVESTRYEFWEALRKYVNIKNPTKVITDLRDPYEYCYMLSKLDRKLVVKYPRTRWDHLFDCVTAREDERIYDWLLDRNKIESNECWQGFIKAIKVYFKNIDTSIYSKEEMFKFYDEIIVKTNILFEQLKTSKKKLSSKSRDEYFMKTKLINSNDKESLLNIIENL